MEKSCIPFVKIGETLIEISIENSQIQLNLMSENQLDINRIFSVKITDESVFRQFKTLQNMKSYLANQENISIDLVKNTMTFKWKVVAKNYESEFQTVCFLSQVKLNQVQTLANENKLLKKIIEIQRQSIKNKIKPQKNNGVGQIQQEQPLYKVEQDQQQNQNQLHNINCLQKHKNQKKQTKNKNINQCKLQNQNKKNVKLQQANYKNQTLLKAKDKSKIIKKQKQKQEKLKHSEPKKAKIEQNYPSKNVIKKYQQKIREQQQKYRKQYTCKKFTIGNKLRIQFFNGDYYFGEVDCHDLYNGEGFYFYNGKGIYEGDFKNGKKHGYGIRTYEDGSRYEGDFFQDDRSGNGKEFFINGDRYSGQFKYDRRHGIGKYQFKEGEYYQGQFKKDLFHGEGKLVEKNGSYFVGKWYSDYKHGEGTMHYSDRLSKQTWKHGKLVKQQNIKIEQADESENDNQ